jgi:hypothetical protein
MPPRTARHTPSVRALRRRVSELGLGWARDWDRGRLEAVLRRAEALERLRVDDLKRMAAPAGGEVEGRPRKSDWVAAILRQEFPASPPVPIAERAAGRPVAAAWLLRISGALGLTLIVLSMALLPVGAWRLSRVVGDQLHSAGKWAQETAAVLRDSANGLTSASEALTSSNLALRSVGTSLSDAQPLLASVGEVLERQAPTAIATARQSLIDAEAGAQSIDRVLRGLSFLGIGYNPDQPLSRSLAETADSLQPLPAALSDAGEHLQTTQEDLGQVSQDVVRVSDDLANMAAQIAPMADDLDRQAGQVEGLGMSMNDLADRAPVWIWGGTALVELLLLIAAVTQYAVWVAGRRWEAEGS